MAVQYDVQIVDVVKHFGDTRVVDHVSLDVRPGEFLTLLGPSGCGKTTTLRMIGGFERPDTGRIFIQGKDVVNIPPAERDTSMVFQDYALFPHMTVAENIAFGLQMRGVKRTEIKARTQEALELVGLPDLGKRKPSQMSGGQKQRVALARSLVLRPAVLLLDEPLGALDAKIRKQMQLELKNIQKHLGQTFIYVTHDQEEALTMSDKIAIMRNGRIEQVGTPEEVYERPATPFVASFLGECNLLQGTVVTRSGGICMFQHPALGTLRGFVNSELPIGSNSTAWFCIRPEDISIEPAGDTERELDEGITVRGIVKELVYRGVVTRYVVGACNEELTVETLGRGTIAPGEPVLLQWEAKNAIIFPLKGSPEVGEDSQ